MGYKATITANEKVQDFKKVKLLHEEGEACERVRSHVCDVMPSGKRLRISTFCLNGTPS